MKTDRLKPEVKMTPLMAGSRSSSSKAVVNCCQISVFNEFTGSLANAMIAYLPSVSTLRYDMPDLLVSERIRVYGYTDAHVGCY